MNELIKQLAIQAGRDDRDGYPVLLEYCSRFAERFAELIVKECANTIESCAPDPASYPKGMRLWTNGYDDGLKTGAFLIKKHFGVEE